jgi:hypothetical protein
VTGSTVRQSVNVGIIGAGLMGREVAAAIARWPALAEHPAAPRLTAVCDIDKDALAWFDRIDSVTIKVTEPSTLSTSRSGTTCTSGSTSTPSRPASTSSARSPSASTSRPHGGSSRH